MNNIMIKENFDPTLHFIPLDKQCHVPIWWIDKDDENGTTATGTFLAITDNGRISAFPATWDIVLVGGKHKGYINSLEQTIITHKENRYPRGKNSDGKKQKQYIFACVMYGDEKKYKLIFDVFGFQERYKEIEYLYKLLDSLHGAKVGDDRWKDVETRLRSEPLRSWINNFISTVKEQSDWADYVRNGIEEEV